MYGLNQLDVLQKEAQCGMASPLRTSVMENLLEQRKMLAERLANIDAAIKALESTPGVADVLEALAKINGY